MEKESRKTLLIKPYVKSGFKSGAVVNCHWLLMGSGVSDMTRQIQEAGLAENLVVDGETYGCVKSFCYLGDTLDGDGGVIMLLQLESEID